MSSSETTSIRLALVDLDGTLIGSSLVPSKDDLVALNRVTDNGVTLAIATGRPLGSALRLVADLPGLGYILPSNGGAIVDVKQGTRVWSGHGFSAETLTLLCAMADRYQVSIHLYTSTAWYTPFMDDNVAREAERSGATPTIGLNRRSAGDTVIKVLYIGAPEVLAAIREEIPTLTSAAIPLDAHYDNYLDISPVGVSKGVACRRLMSHLGLDPGQIIAIGDGENDVDMLSAVGVGVAVRNACPALVEVATYLTVDCEEGAVAAATEGIIFGEPKARQVLWQRLGS